MRDENMSPTRRGARGDARGAGRGDRDRARAERRVPAGRVPRRPRRRAVPAVRGDGRSPSCISGFVALTLTPALCALLLKPATTTTGAREDVPPFNRAFARVTHRFLGGVDLALPTGRRRSLFGAIIALAGLLFWRLPNSFVPSEDQGYLIAAASLPDGATLERTSPAQPSSYSKMMAGNQAVGELLHRQRASISSAAAASRIQATMVPADEAVGGAQADGAESWRREESSGKGFALADGIAFAFNPPAIQGARRGRRLRGLRAGAGSTPIRSAWRRSPNDFMNALRAAARAGRHQHLLPADRAAAARRGRSRKGARARRGGERRLRRAAGRRWARSTSTTSTSRAAPIAWVMQADAELPRPARRPGQHLRAFEHDAER